MAGNKILSTECTAKPGVKRTKPVIISTAIAHALAWAAFLWLVLWPYAYQGASVTPVGPGGGGGEPTRMSASFIEANGLEVLPLLLVPVILTGLGFGAILLTSQGQTRSKLPLGIMLWGTAVLLLGFCLVGIASIGIFYLPAALALLVSANSGSSKETAST